MSFVHRPMTLGAVLPALLPHMAMVGEVSVLLSVGRGAHHGGQPVLHRRNDPSAAALLSELHEAADALTSEASDAGERMTARAKKLQRAMPTESGWPWLERAGDEAAQLVGVYASSRSGAFRTFRRRG